MIDEEMVKTTIISNNFDNYLKLLITFDECADETNINQQVQILSNASYADLYLNKIFITKKMMDLYQKVGLKYHNYWNGFELIVIDIDLIFVMKINILNKLNIKNPNPHEFTNKLILKQYCDILADAESEYRKYKIKNLNL